MKKKQFSMEQIIGVLKQSAMGVHVAEVIRKVGLGERRTTLGLEVDAVCKMAQLQEETCV